MQVLCKIWPSVQFWCWCLSHSNSSNNWVTTCNTILIKKIVNSSTVPANTNGNCFLTAKILSSIIDIAHNVQYMRYHVRLRSEAIKATKFKNIGSHPTLKPDEEKTEGMLCTYLTVMQYFLVTAKFAVLCSCWHSLGVTRIIVSTIKYMYIYVI